MNWARPLLAALLLLAGVVGVALLVSRARSRPPAPAEVTSTPVPTPEPATVVLFFPGPDLLLHRERRQIPELPRAVHRCAVVVMEELLAGSQEGWASPFTWAATVDAAFVLGDGSVVLDLTPPPAGHVQGTAAELALAYSAVNSVVANCANVPRLQLLFGGKQVESFGHLDLSQPLPPRPDLVAP